MQDHKAQEILKSYREDVERWKERGGTHYKDIQPLSINDVLFIKSVLHPTNKAQSKQVTFDLVTFLCDKEIVTAQQVYTEMGMNDRTFLKRVKIFQQFGLIRREGKKYYLPTPRMQELCKKYLRRICS